MHVNGLITLSDYSVCLSRGNTLYNQDSANLEIILFSPICVDLDDLFVAIDSLNGFGNRALFNATNFCSPVKYRHQNTQYKDFNCNIICNVYIRDLPFSTYAILHAIWTPPPPFYHVIRNGNVWEA